MQTITIKIQAYGEIERQLPIDLSMQCQTATPVAEILRFIVQAYPEVTTMLGRCAYAIADNMISPSMELNTDTTLVLLSPVAGG